MEMKTVGEGEWLWVVFLFCVARSPNPSGKKVKKVNACEQAKVTLGQGQNCQSK